MDANGAIYLVVLLHRVLHFHAFYAAQLADIMALLSCYQSSPHVLSVHMSTWLGRDVFCTWTGPMAGPRAN